MLLTQPFFVALIEMFLIYKVHGQAYDVSTSHEIIIGTTTSLQCELNNDHYENKNVSSDVFKCTIDYNNENATREVIIKSDLDTKTPATQIPILKQLFHKGFYHPNDFAQNNAIPYWTNGFASIHLDKNSQKQQSTFSWGPCYASKEDENLISQWDPINPKKSKDSFEEAEHIKPLEYTSSVSRKKSDEDEDVAEHCRWTKSDKKDSSNMDNINGMCRPGFLIIGAGKCGTSSLYHYLVQHPRVIPARQKQVGFFKYFVDKGLKCYLSYFPNIREFMSSGALITGESFPGYLPYPQVIPEVRRLLGGEPKIIVSVRDPISRAYSSYKYNYVRMALHHLREEDDFIQTNEYYIENHLFTFEELIRAELHHLKVCLQPGGKAEVLTMQKYPEMASRRMNNNSTNYTYNNYPLIDVEQCFTNTKISDARDPLFVHEGYHLSKLMKQYPEKILDIPETNHLIRSMLARGLYILAVDWWYESFTKDNIHIACLEELSKSTESMDSITSFLGLPQHNFTSILKKGRYNAGGNEGFNSLTQTSDEKMTKSTEEVPISDGLRLEIQEFLADYNERLFERMGRRCSW